MIKGIENKKHNAQIAYSELVDEQKTNVITKKNSLENGNKKKYIEKKSEEKWNLNYTSITLCRLPAPAFFGVTHFVSAVFS